MARRPRLMIGGRGPGGPMASGIPAFGGQAPKRDRKAAGLEVPRHDNRSKKSYAGTVAGVGRPPGERKPLHPIGPAGRSFRSVRGSKPSLMTRIGRRIGRFFGIQPSRPRPT